MRIYLLLFCLLFIACKGKRGKVDFQYVISKFEESSDTLNRIEYNVRRIDTFAFGGNVWNNEGHVLIEKNENDKIYGFSFYSKRNDIDREYLYDLGNGFEIFSVESKYKMKDVGGFMGSPGGQMVLRNIFHLDSIYKAAKLIEEEDRFVLKYQFEDDTISDILNIQKTGELSKENYFPIKVTTSSIAQGNKGSTHYLLKDIKANTYVEKSINSLKESLKDFEIIQPAESEPNPILGKELPKISLPKLHSENEIFNLQTDKITLIDFWEVWCGPCIKSLGEVEKLKNAYSDKLQVIGIMTENKEGAIQLVKKKKTTFINLIGNKEILQKYNVNSYPRYFLIDKKGIVQKEYFGFSEKIERDIKSMIAK